MSETDIHSFLIQKLEDSESDRLKALQDKTLLIATLQNLLSNNSGKSIADARNVLSQLSDQKK